MSTAWLASTCVLSVATALAAPGVVRASGDDLNASYGRNFGLWASSQGVVVTNVACTHDDVSVTCYGTSADGATFGATSPLPDLAWEALGGMGTPADSSLPPPSASTPPASPGQGVPTTSGPGATSSAIATEPTCTYVGVGTFSGMQIEISFTNPLGDVPRIEVTYALLDASGVRFHTGSQDVEAPAANERFRLQSDTYTDPPSSVDGMTCVVLAIEEGFELWSLAEPSATDSCQIVEVNSIGNIEVELTVSNPFAQTEDLLIRYALRGPEDVRIADDGVSVDLVAPGEAVRVSGSTTTSPPAWATLDSITCSVLGAAVF